MHHNVHSDQRRCNLESELPQYQLLTSLVQFKSKCVCCWHDHIIALQLSFWLTDLNHQQWNVVFLSQ